MKYTDYETAIVEKNVSFEIKKILHRGCKQLMLFPYGKYGRIVKRVLNEEYSVQEIGILDNRLSKSHEDIKPLDYLKEHPLQEGEYLVITSSNGAIFCELRDEVKKYVPENQIIDFFSKNKVLGVAEYMEEIARRAGFDFRDNIYQLKKYDVRLYLPYWRTDSIQRNILKNDKYYEDEYLFFIKTLIGNKIGQGIVLDIGANIGNHSLYWALECGAKNIYAFEPVKDTFAILKKNIALNELEDVVKLFNLGVGEKNSRADICEYSLENIGGTKLRDNSEGKIEICAIDEMNIKESVSLMKIDVEGYEVQVLRGAINTIKKYMPYIMIEAWDYNQSIFDLIDLLCPLGYSYMQVSESDYLFFIK